MRLFPLDSAARFGTMMIAGVLLAGCASYGSFDENEPGLEQSILGDVGGVVGLTPEEEPIEYSARAPLVAPPSTDRLPTPQSETALVADPNWPTGSRERMAQVLLSEDQTLVYTPGVDGVDIAATQALAQRGSQPQQESNAGLDRPLLPHELQREEDIQLARTQANAAREADAAVRGRRFLTDPPVASRTPSPEAPYGADAEELAEAEQGGFSWWPF
ncbi:MAG: hypothetical protein ACE360_13945 [Hyphomicrobiales bacterium]